MDWKNELAKLSPYASVGFCGAGGKTSNLWALSEEILKIQQSVLITTTTKMFPYESLNQDQIVSRETFDESVFKNWDRVQWFSKIDGEGKGHSPSKEALANMHKYTDIWRLFEIDGAKRLSIKAPNEEEPIYPYELDWVYGCISGEVIGKKANAQWVHRLAYFTKVTGCQEGDLIDLEVICRLVESPKGLFQHKPIRTGATLILTKVRPEQLPLVEILKERLSLPVEVTLWQET